MSATASSASRLVLTWHSRRHGLVNLVLEAGKKSRQVVWHAPRADGAQRNLGQGFAQAFLIDSLTPAFKAPTKHIRADAPIDKREDPPSIIGLDDEIVSTDKCAQNGADVAR